MVLLRRSLIGLLLFGLAYQLVVMGRAWKGAAVAESWIEALHGENTCGRTFTVDEAVRFERLATVWGTKLTASERSETDCYLRDKNRLEKLDRVYQDSGKAKDVISNATIVGAAAAIIAAILARIERFHRRRAT